jgi:Fibronectin type III domain
METRTKTWGALLLVASLLLPEVFAQAPAPPSNLTAADHPWDDGSHVDLKWALSSDDASIEGYVVREKAADAPDFKRIDLVPKGTTTFTVGNLDPQKFYVFEVVAVAPGNRESAPAATASPIQPTREWFDGTRLWFLVTLLIFSGAVIAFITTARRGAKLKLRKIPALKAVSEAIGRATEMGRPCLFVPGIQDMNDIQTIAGLNVLSRVATTTAEYDARLEVPTNRPLVMTAAREVVESSYLSAGRPDAYSPDSIYVIPDEQFAYVAYVQGYMVREKPAACFYMGGFFAESLILAETGNRIGAIQIAGTAQPAQLPFFVAACDYTLIGEELFAASAYLSQEPDQLGTLKGQDVGKIIVTVGIVVGVIAATIASITGSGAVQAFVDYLKGTVLT